MRRRLSIALGLLVVGAALWIILTLATPPIITVEWSTASELNTAGYNIYRSLSPDEPGVRLNTALIPASPDPLVGGSYVYTDTQVTSGQTYYYRLEEVETDGSFNSPGVVSATASGGFTPLLPVIGLTVLVGLLAVVWLGRRAARHPVPEQPS